MPEFDSTLEYRDLTAINLPGYQVGNDGTVWTCRKSVALGRGGRGSVTNVWRQLTPSPNRAGYCYVDLCRNGKPIRFAIHALVLTLFVGPCPPGMECCHDPDPNPANNHRSNLRWGTRQDNRADSVRRGAIARGERCRHAKLKPQDVLKIRADHAQAKGNRKNAPSGTNKRLARQFGVSRGLIRLVVAGTIWKHLLTTTEVT